MENFTPAELTKEQHVKMADIIRQAKLEHIAQVAPNGKAKNRIPILDRNNPSDVEWYNEDETL